MGKMAYCCLVFHPKSTFLTSDYLNILLLKIIGFCRKIRNFADIMGRILAIDYGFKRCGIAVTDESRIIATPLDTIEKHKLLEFLEKYISTNTVDIIVMGLPVDMKGKESEVEPEIRGFLKKLGKQFPTIPIERYDERFTSRMAFQSLIDAGATKSQRREKGNIDKVSAAIILQSFMQYRQKQ